MQNIIRRLLLLTAAASTVSASTLQTPTFYARQDYVGLSTQWVSVGDTNGDGIPDMIATSQGLIYVMFGNGDGTFRTGPSTLAIQAATTQTIPVDLNGDGKVDLVFAGDLGENPGGFIVCLGNGDGTFQSGKFYPAGTDEARLTGFLAVGDFNGDGLADVAQVGPSGIWLSTGKGDGTFHSSIVAVPLESGGTGLAAADFNGDRKLDIVVTVAYAGSEQDQGDGFFVLLGNGDGTFQKPQHLKAAGRPFFIVAGPLGPNNFPGIAISNLSESYIAVYPGNGVGGFASPKHLDMVATGNGLAIADLNGDGISDIAAGALDVEVAYGTALGTFRQPVEFPVQATNGIYNLAVADLRKDGRMDLLSDSQFGISVLLNSGKSFEEGIFTTLSAAAGCGVVNDFNGDGKPDVAVNTSEGISILLGTGKAAKPFTVGQSLTLPNAGCLTQSSDVNGDGIPDLVITSATAVVTYLGNGDGTFTQKSQTPISTVAEYVVLADFNHDGKLDFATDGNLLALGNGDGTFQTPAPFAPPAPVQGYSNIAVGDINNDGWPDIVLTNLGTPYTNLYVGLNNHNGGFTQIPSNPMIYGDDATEAILIDLNGDGNLDLVSNANIYLGDGKGDFTFLSELNDPEADGVPLPSMVADLNGDGIPDIAVLSPGTVGIYLGLGNAAFAAPFYLGTGPAPGTIFPANLHGQKASKGLPDLVAPDESGGVTVLLNITK